MPELVELLINSNYKVINYDIRGFWIDIGNLEDYNKASEYIKYNNNG